MITARAVSCSWIRGEKLSESDAPDVRELCNSLLNAYLVQHEGGCAGRCADIYWSCWLLTLCSVFFACYPLVSLLPESTLSCGDLADGCSDATEHSNHR
eukprot:scaffold258197_cov19-Tisochrysis_lutea.AAC.1